MSFYKYFFLSSSLQGPYFHFLAKSMLRMSIQSPCKRQWVNLIYLWRVDFWQLLCVVKKCFTCWQLHLNSHFCLLVWFHWSLFWVPILAAKVPYFIKVGSLFLSLEVPISEQIDPYFNGWRSRDELGSVILLHICSMISFGGFLAECLPCLDGILWFNLARRESSVQTIGWEESKRLMERSRSIVT